MGYEKDLILRVNLNLLVYFQDGPTQVSALSSYVSCVHAQRNGKKAKLLFDLLEALVENNIVPPKYITLQFTKLCPILILLSIMVEYSCLGGLSIFHVLLE